ncbi:tyrosine-type recombinase/integrase [Candidatus Margulisiibacteriota bacterium]
MNNLFQLKKLPEEELDKLVKRGKITRLEANIVQLPDSYLEFFTHLRTGKAERTLYSIYYKITVIEQLLGKSLLKMSPIDFDNLILKMESTYRKSSVSIYLAIIRVFYRFMVKRGYINQNPVDADFRYKSDYERIPFHLKPSVMQKIYEILDKRVNEAANVYAADRSKYAKETLLRMEMMRLAIRLLADTGARISEIKKIQLHHINPRTDGQAICRIHNAKVKNGGDRTRKVLLSKDAIKALHSYVKIAPAEIQASEKVLITVTIRQVQYWIHDIRDKLYSKGYLEVKKLSPHDFRKFFGTQLVSNGVSDFNILKLMGQSNLASLRPYIEISDDLVVECYSKLNKD